jgi:hypothetical protein
LGRALAVTEAILDEIEKPAGSTFTGAAPDCAPVAGGRK